MKLKEKQFFLPKKTVCVVVAPVSNFVRRETSRVSKDMPVDNTAPSVDGVLDVATTSASVTTDTVNEVPSLALVISNVEVLNAFVVLDSMAKGVFDNTILRDIEAIFYFKIRSLGELNVLPNEQFKQR